MMTLIIISNVAQAQIFPGLTGQELVESLQSEFTPGVLLTDAQAKDTLYAVVFNNEDSVYCMYTGLTRYLPPGEDPSQWLFGTGTETVSMNLEHGWPQSKGAGEGTMGNRDMHHLFPSRTMVNSFRANHPFDEIQDAQTTRWFYKDQEMTQIPASNIDAYSEYRNGAFEPRESVKGDVARAMFYFWTIYREDALTAAPTFFEIQQEDLCAWHQLDPADAEELDRTMRIAAYQDGKLNPFVLDCSLAQRAYCPDLEKCTSLNTEDGSHKRPDGILRILPDGFSLRDHVEGKWEITVFDMSGRKIYAFALQGSTVVQKPDLPSGLYLFSSANGQEIISETHFVIEP